LYILTFRFIDSRREDKALCALSLLLETSRAVLHLSTGFCLPTSGMEAGWVPELVWTPKRSGRRKENETPSF